MQSRCPKAKPVDVLVYDQCPIHHTRWVDKALGKLYIL